MLKKTSAAGSVAIAAIAGVLFTGSPASAQGPTLVQGHHRHHFRVSSSNRNHNRNVNLNRNRVVVHVRVHNRNNNVAVANNRARRDGFFRGDGFFRRDGFRGDGFFRRNCCRERFDDDDDFGGRRFDRFGGTDRIRAGEVSVRLGGERGGLGGIGGLDGLDD